MPLRIYTGILGQIGDIVAFTPTARRLKELFPDSELTFAVSRRYREAGELVAGLPYVDRLFVTDLYFERLTPALLRLWEQGWPLDLSGEDEVAEQRRHDLVFETRPRHRRQAWWEFAHLTEEAAHMVGVPAPVERRTQVCLPAGATVPPGSAGKLVLHNDPALDPRKGWPWELAREFAQAAGPENVVLLGGPGPPVPGALDLRGRASLLEAAACIAASRCFVGIDSGLMWIAGSLQVPTVGLYGTDFIPAYDALYPANPRAVYLQVEGPLSYIHPESVLAAVRRTNHAIDRV